MEKQGWQVDLIVVVLYREQRSREPGMKGERTASLVMEIQIKEALWALSSFTFIHFFVPNYLYLFGLSSSYVKCIDLIRNF
jgi:hypothetical protein